MYGLYLQARIQFVGEQSKQWYIHRLDRIRIKDDVELIKTTAEVDVPYVPPTYYDTMKDGVEQYKEFIERAKNVEESRSLVGAVVSIFGGWVEQIKSDEGLDSHPLFVGLINDVAYTQTGIRLMLQDFSWLGDVRIDESEADAKEGEPSSKQVFAPKEDGGTWSLREIMEYVVRRIGRHPSNQGIQGLVGRIKLNIQKEITATYNHFVFGPVTGNDIVKKVKDDLNNNIYYSVDIEGGNLRGISLNVMLRNLDAGGDPVDYSYDVFGNPLRFAYDTNILKHDLVYKNRAHRAVAVELEVIEKDGSRKTYRNMVNGKPVMEDDAFRYIKETRYNISPKLAQQKANGIGDRLNYTGLYGTFTTYAIPRVRVGDRVQLLEPERNLSPQTRAETYIAEAVHTDISVRGGRQKVRLGIRTK